MPSGRPLDVPDPISFLEAVKTEFVGDSLTYPHFLYLIDNWYGGRLDTGSVVDAISVLLRGKPELLRDFNVLLPSNYRIECSTDFDSVTLLTVITPTGARIQSTVDNSSLVPPSPRITTTEELRYFLSLEHEWKKIVNLEVSWASCVLQLLQTDLDDWCLEPQYRKKCLRCLRALVQSSEALPPSFFLRNIIREGEHPVWGGGFADIYKGRFNQQVVCFKVLRIFTTNLDREKLFKTFCHEAIVWRQLNHPNVLPFFGVSKELFAPSFCLISPWMENGNIMKYLEAHPEHDRMTSITEIAEGLRYLHELTPSIIHGDIRGANILVTDDFRCCLCDFGLSTIIDSQVVTAAASIRGTIRWLAPELMNPGGFSGLNAQVEMASDIYAYGCTVLEIYTGKAPFPDHKQDVAVMYDVLEGVRPPRPPSKVNLQDETWSLVESCWAQQPQERPTIGQVVQVLAGSLHPHNDGARDQTLTNSPASTAYLSTTDLASLTTDPSYKMQVAWWLKREMQSNANVTRPLDPTPSPSPFAIPHRKNSSATLDSSLGVSTVAGSKSHSQSCAEKAIEFRILTVTRNTGGHCNEKPANTSEPHLPQAADTDPSPVSFNPYELSRMFDPKSFEVLQQFGGVRGLVRRLGTSTTHGLGDGNSGLPCAPGIVRTFSTPMDDSTEDGDGNSGLPSLPGIVRTCSTPMDDLSEDGDGLAFSTSLDQRRKVYGENVLLRHSNKGLLQSSVAAMKDKVMILLSIAAIVSVTLGVVQDFSTIWPTANGRPHTDWVEGAAVLVAIFVVVVVGSLNDWQKERQLQSLGDKEKRTMKVIRNATQQVIDVKEVVVGDIALLERGEIIPCDGVYLGGHDVKCDESGVTGELDAIKKVSYDECLAVWNRQAHEIKGNEGIGGFWEHTDCLIISGSKVLDGVGSYVVVAVGMNSFNGRMTMRLRRDSQNTPLQLKLNTLAGLIAKLGSATSLLLFTALTIRFIVQLVTDNTLRTANVKAITYIDILIIALTLVIVAAPKGSPLAVALAFATRRMTYEKLLVRELMSCETIANASMVCTGKTGTLTQNKMTVVAGTVGVHAKFVRQLEHSQPHTNDEQELSQSGTWEHLDDFFLDQAQLNTALSPQLQNLLNLAISISSTAFQDNDPETGRLIFVGNETEIALLTFAKELGWSDSKITRDSEQVAQMIPFSSERKAAIAAVKLSNRKWRVYLNGASEVLSKRCTRYVVVHKDSTGEGQGADVETAAIDELTRDNICHTIIFYSNQGLRTIALCYKDFTSWPPEDLTHNNQNEAEHDSIPQELTLISIIAIEDPLRPGVCEAVSKCQRAGVMVKMCTGDNVLMARSIAMQCGIYTPGGLIMEGSTFRQLNQLDMAEIIPRLQVLARCSPEDKKTLVETLKSFGDVVGVTGYGINDGTALKVANVGFSLGIRGTETAKEASDMVLMDDDFSSIVRAMMWGRCVNDAVRKTLQFQLSTNFAAISITFISAVSSATEESIFSAVQLLWITIIMDAFAILALTSDPASETLLKRKPDTLTTPLLSVNMYKQIMCQSLYQISISLIFHFVGLGILGLQSGNDQADHSLVVNTLVFNIFIFAQIFNLINSRRLDQKLNVFEGLCKNPNFIVIILIEIIVQVLIIFVGGTAFRVTRIGAREWGISLSLGVVPIPLGALIRLAPNGPFEWLFMTIGLLKTSQHLPTTRVGSVEWRNWAQSNSSTTTDLRGVRSSSLRGRSRFAYSSYNNQPERQLPVLFPPNNPNGATLRRGQLGCLSDPANYTPSQTSTAIWERKVELHPDTAEGDPASQRFRTIYR